jgi:hypothetical protein
MIICTAYIGTRFLDLAKLQRSENDNSGDVLRSFYAELKFGFSNSAVIYNNNGYPWKSLHKRLLLFVLLIGIQGRLKYDNMFDK